MNDIEKMSYALGMNVAGNICELPLEIDNAAFVKALETVLAGKEPELSQEEYAQNMQKFQQEVQAAGQKAMKAAADQNRAAGEEFLAANAKKATKDIFNLENVLLETLDKYNEIVAKNK